MSYFKILVSVFILWVTYNIVVIYFGIKPCYAQYYEGDCYSDNVYGGHYNSSTIIVDEYDAYSGYRGYSIYDRDSDIINHYDVERGYSGFSTVNKRSGIVEYYENGVGYRGYSQVYLGK